MKIDVTTAYAAQGALLKCSHNNVVNFLFVQPNAGGGN